MPSVRPRFILASASPQRKSLLEGLGMAFEVVPPGCLESDSAETDPAKRCSALAKMKAEDVSAKHLDAAVLGCDTLVAAADGTLLEKPVDARNARRMLRFLGGQEATVHSAVRAAAARISDATHPVSDSGRSRMPMSSGGSLRVSGGTARVRFRSTARDNS